MTEDWATWHKLSEPRAWTFDFGYGPNWIQAREYAHAAPNDRGDRRHIGWLFRVNTPHISLALTWANPLHNESVLQRFSACHDAFYYTRNTKPEGRIEKYCSACGEGGGRGSWVGQAILHNELFKERSVKPLVEEWLDDGRSPLESALILDDCVANLREVQKNRKAINAVLGLDLWVDE